MSQVDENRDDEIGTISAEPRIDAAAAPSGPRRRAPDLTVVMPGASSALDTPNEDSSPKLESTRLRYRLPTVERENYEILGEIAVGGIGRIRRAREDRLGRPVAIKELLGEASPVVEARFVREALITARLQHPSIIPIYEAGRWPSGELFYAMKLVAGRSLAEVLEGRSYAKRLELLPHVLAVAEAVAYAHSRHILHRDLKPSNILVGEFGETLVIDWGLAKDLSEHQQPPVLGLAPPRGPAFDSYSREGTAGESLTMTGAVIGTPAYMPPEQAAGTAVDERADVYSIGAILYHVLAGCPPYGGGPPMDVVRQVLTGPPTPLQQHQRGIAEDLSTIVEKAMARAPLTRYPTALELADDLRRFQTGQIVGAHVYSSSDLVRRFAFRHRVTLLVAVIAFVALAVLGVVGLRRVLAERRLAEGSRAAEACVPVTALVECTDVDERERRSRDGGAAADIPGGRPGDLCRGQGQRSGGAAFVGAARRDSGGAGHRFGRDGQLLGSPRLSSTPTLEPHVFASRPSSASKLRTSRISTGLTMNRSKPAARAFSRSDS